VKYNGRVPKLENPRAAPSMSEPPETVEEEPKRAEPQPATREDQEGVQRPWWRRVFGVKACERVVVATSYAVRKKRAGAESLTFRLVPLGNLFRGFPPGCE
jgi:hypothetical protein